MPLKLKLDDNGHAVLQDGKPVYVDDADNKEYPLDGAHLYGRVRDLTAENAQVRKAKEDHEAALKAFEGIEDPAKAIEALQTVAALDQGSLYTAGKVKEIQDAAKKTAEEQVANAAKASAAKIADLERERDGFRGELHSEKIGNAFSRSKFLGEKAAIPSDFVQARFGTHFKVENGAVVAYRNPGDEASKVFSHTNPGVAADFEEAIHLLIEGHPDKEVILKGEGHSGGGAEGGDKGGKGGFGGSSKGNMGGTKTERVEALKSRFPELGKAS